MENGNFAFVKISHTDIRRANAPTGRRKPMIFVRNAMICPRKPEEEKRSSKPGDDLAGSGAPTFPLLPPPFRQSFMIAWRQP
jgi:hypothetical protein